MREMLLVIIICVICWFFAWVSAQGNRETELNSIAELKNRITELERKLSEPKKQYGEVIISHPIGRSEFGVIVPAQLSSEDMETIRKIQEAQK